MQHMLFELGRGVRLVPRFSVDKAGKPIAADGVRFFSPEQAAAREATTLGEMIDWWNDYVAEVLPGADVDSLIKDASADAAIAPSPAPAQEQRLRQLRRFLYPDLNDGEFDAFVAFCDERQFNPWCRHVWPELRQEGGRRTLIFITTIDGFRLIAERTREYLPGTTRYVDSHGEAHRFWRGGDPPIAALVSVRRRGERCWADASWASYAPMIRVDGREVAAGMWATKPDVMLSKCAEARALRKAFPHELSGLYTADEVERHDDPAAARAIQPAPLGQPAQLPGQVPDAPVTEETPENFGRFKLEVIDLVGSQKADNVIGHFGALLGGRYSSTSPHFYATVLAELRRNPAAYGAAEAVAA